MDEDNNACVENPEDNIHGMYYCIVLQYCSYIVVSKDRASVVHDDNDANWRCSCC